MKSSGGVLVIDDDAGIRNLLCSALASDYSVQVASSGEEGLKRYQQARADVVLLDVMLPEMSGIAVLRQLKKMTSNLPVIMMTAYAEVHTAIEAIKLGAADYVEKPFDPQRVIEEIALIMGSRSINPEVAHHGITGDSPAMQRVWRLVERFGPTGIPILLQGESGTGKSAFARAIHALSKRAQGPFVDIDCGTIPEQLAESELFGYEDGAFTGAGKKKVGRVAFADHGTLFLDEIGVLSLASQSKLLTLIENQTFTPLGARDARSRHIDMRFISATNVPLQDAIAKGTFRQDLYHRLNGITIELPSLREREGDIELLARHFLREFRTQYEKPECDFSEDALDLIRAYRWPGNVRELQRAMMAAVIMADRLITPDDLPAQLRSQSPSPDAPPVPGNPQSDDFTSIFQSGGRLTLGQIKEWAGREAEKRVIMELQKQTKASQQDLARMLGVDPKTLRSRLKEIAETKSNNTGS
ncbi:MAG TPA: sigma-54 dependent transcriptional regulator [Terriglobales bacterium]|nr:sigma-54 dependent transcriptional regulator [Terriglobales bacterium]